MTNLDKAIKQNEERRRRLASIRNVRPVKMNTHMKPRFKKLLVARARKLPTPAPPTKRPTPVPAPPIIDDDHALEDDDIMPPPADLQVGLNFIDNILGGAGGAGHDVFRHDEQRRRLASKKKKKKKKK